MDCSESTTCGNDPQSEVNPTLKTVATWLRVLTNHGGAVEVRSFRNRKPRVKVFPPGTEPQDIATHALMEDKTCEAVYLTLNPLRADLTSAASDADVMRRAWIFLDIDPKRPAGISATAAEKKAAFKVCRTICAALVASGFPPPIVADSGNGWHLLFKVDLPNSEESHELVHSLLVALNETFGTEIVSVDTAVANASRICKVYGTTPRKGEPTAERPHRASRIVTIPAGIELLTDEAIRRVLAVLQAESGHKHESNGKPHDTATRGDRVGDDYNRRGDPLAVLKRHGWTEAGTGKGTAIYLTRPGKAAADGWSATYNRQGDRRLFVFSDNARPFEPWKCYAPFAVFTFLEHSGDFGKAAAALAAQGYGTQTTEASVPPWPPLRLREPPPAEPFPLDVFPEPIAHFIEAVSESIGCAPDFPALQCLTIAAGVIGRSVSLLLKSGYFARASIYGACVGPVSDGKSPSLEQTTEPVATIDRELEDQFKEALTAWEATGTGKHGKPPGPAPIPKRIDVENFTLEKLFEVIAANPRGILSKHDELSGLFTGLNQYKARGKGNDRDHLLSIWSGASFKLDRKSLGAPPLRVSHPCLSIIGGIQDTRLANLGFDVGDGLIERFVFAYPEPRPVPYWSEQGVDEAVAKPWAEVVVKLWNRTLAEKDGQQVPHVMYMTDQGKIAWVGHYHDHVDQMNAGDFNPALRGAWGKFREYPGRFALILSLLWQATDFAHSANFANHSATREDFDRAWKLMGYFKHHTLRVHHEVTGGGLGRDGREILTWIRRRGCEEFSERDVKSHLRRYYASPDTLRQALTALESIHAIRPKSGQRSGPGRPPGPTFEVHPDLLDPSRNSRNSQKNPPEPPEPPPGEAFREFREFREPCNGSQSTTEGREVFEP